MVREYSSRGEEVRKISFLTVIMMRYNSFSIDEVSSFIIEECASLRKISLSRLRLMGYCGMSRVFMKCSLKMADTRSFIILRPISNKDYFCLRVSPAL